MESMAFHPPPLGTHSYQRRKPPKYDLDQHRLVLEELSIDEVGARIDGLGHRELGFVRDGDPKAATEV